MVITILLCAIALGVGVWTGWVLGSARWKARIVRAEQARAVAEARVADVQRMENAFAATAQRVFAEVGTTIVQQNRVQVDGSLDTKKAEFATMLEPLSKMLDEYRSQVSKSEHERTHAYG